MIKRNGRGGLLTRRNDEQEPGLFDDHDLHEEAVDAVEMSAESDEEDENHGGEQSGRKRVWTKVQFGLAALSATPLLFIGGLGGWPWEDDAASAKSTVVAGQEGYPVAVQIERIGLDAAITALRLATQPPALGGAGWDLTSPEPGDAGRTVIAGRRVLSGPDAFGRLDDTKVGDRIVVTNAIGEKLQYVVRSVERFQVGQVPEGRIYGGPQKEAQLRLISSSGAYKANKGGFQQNIVVFADLVT